LWALAHKRLLASAGDDHDRAHRVEPHGWAILELQP
jgi:hypothetical protein